MVDYSTPWRMGQEGLMTGVQIGTRMRERREAREVGGLMSSGNVQGARDAAYQQGDLRTGQHLDGQVTQRATAERGLQLTGMLREGDYAGAEGLAQTPQELQQLTEFRNTASEAEKAAAVQRSEQLATVVGSIMTLPPEQQFAAAQQAAARMGMDPNAITPDMVTPQALEGMRMQAMGLAAYLQHQDRETDNRRQEEQFAETRRHNQATEGVAQARVGVTQSREARVAAGRTRSGGGSRPSGGARPSAPASRPPWERF